MVGVRGEGHDAVTVREAQGAAVRAVAPLLHAGYGGGGEVAEEVVGVERGAEGEAEGEGAGARAGRGAGGGAGDAVPGGAGAQFARGERVDLADRVVEGADGGEPGREGDVGHGQRGGLDQQPGGLRALRPGEGEGARAQFGEELALDLAGAVAEAGGEAGDALPVHDSVGDQPHGAGGEVGPPVPLGGAGAGVRAAALAGPEPGLLAGRRARVERHVAGFGRHHRAAGPAVDAGGQDGREEPAVEARVLRLHGAHAALGVGVHSRLHVSRMACGTEGSWRESDTDVTRAALLRITPAARPTRAAVAGR
ncbi:hypothetical protein STENM223S_07129 [Streptomyces tendae]